MAEWLTFWFTPTGAATLVGSLLGYVSWAYPHVKGELEGDPSYRTDVAKALTDHSWLQRYRSTLQRALDWLYSRMGAPYSPRALGVCVTISMVYALIFFLGSWTLGGPGTVGNTELLSRLPWWQQLFWGVLALVYVSVAAWTAYRSEQIDRTIQDWLRQRLNPRFGERAEATTRWLYRLGGVGGSVSILLAAAFYAEVSGPVAVLGAIVVALAVAAAVTGALIGVGPVAAAV